MPAKFVLAKDASGRFNFRLMSQGRVLASSESYTTKRAAQNAIASIRTTAPGAQIDDGTQSDARKAAPVKSRTVAKKLESAVKVARRRGRAAAESLVAPTAAATAEAPAKRTRAKRAPAVAKAPATTKAAKATKTTRAAKAAKK